MMHGPINIKFISFILLQLFFIKKEIFYNEQSKRTSIARFKIFITKSLLNPSKIAFCNWMFHSPFDLATGC